MQKKIHINVLNLEKICNHKKKIVLTALKRNFPVNICLCIWLFKCRPGKSFKFLQTALSLMKFFSLQIWVWQKQCNITKQKKVIFRLPWMLTPLDKYSRHFKRHEALQRFHACILIWEQVCFQENLNGKWGMVIVTYLSSQA